MSGPHPPHSLQWGRSALRVAQRCHAPGSLTLEQPVHFSYWHICFFMFSLFYCSLVGRCLSFAVLLSHLRTTSGESVAFLLYSSKSSKVSGSSWLSVWSVSSWQSNGNENVEIWCPLPPQPDPKGWRSGPMWRLKPLWPKSEFKYTLTHSGRKSEFRLGYSWVQLALLWMI